MRLASFYSPHTLKEERVCEPHLDTLLRDSYLIMGYYNGTTHMSHTRTLRANVWPWLAAKEKKRVPCLTFYCRTPTVSRTPECGASPAQKATLTVHTAHGCTIMPLRVIDFSSVHGASDHDPITVSTIPWTTPHLPETRCAHWNRRDVQLYRALVSRALQDVEAPDSSQDVKDCYSRISGCMLASMRQVNASRPQTTRPPPDVSDWYQLVKQLVRQAKRRSKTFFRRFKHTLLTPPSPSNLPVPTRKILGILQRNSPWCRSAAEYIPWSSTLPDVPPLTVPELRSLARSACKKSPGPDGVPPYLLSILPDTCFSLVHRCLPLCYETGHIPHAWLTSETLSVYKGKGPWRDPDR